MASFMPLWLLPLIFLYIFGAAAGDGQPSSAAFTLSVVRRKPLDSSSSSPTAPFRSSLSRAAADHSRGKGPSSPKNLRTPPPPQRNYTVKYTMALTITLPIGVPPQYQRMVLDTGSQLMWMPCLMDTAKPTASKAATPPLPMFHNHTGPFSISMSNTLSFFPCKESCKPKMFHQGVDNYCNADYTTCTYSTPYADGTLSEGTLVRENITDLANSSSQSDPGKFLMGCANSATDSEGILGMNLGDYSFISQSKYQTFSYCVPVREMVHGRRRYPDGAFYLGVNPNSATFNYTKLLSFSDAAVFPPSLNLQAYVVNMTGIRIGGKKLDIPVTDFVNSTLGEGQTIIDSGTEYTLLVNHSYWIIKEEVRRLTGANFKMGYLYQGVMDMCIDGSATAIGEMLGNMTFEFDNAVEIFIPGERLAFDVDGRNVSCLGIGNSGNIDEPSNLVGNFHQQNLWVEFDLARFRVGFGKADCSRALL
ncbi:unnamed protein product [Cuscuta europaea]|uniref:Peptidase A1 domain-containing protein n=1 Tax=Cuscuta europaea TaxID=41803 RepID=A0A9P0ZP31_CUSEU|nr:unnamed protein product [Cuscuta europaea]